MVHGGAGGRGAFWARQVVVGERDAGVLLERGNALYFQ
jgi:hypothetical protein